MFKISSTMALPGVRLQAVRSVGVPYDIHSPDDPKLLEQIWHKDYVSIILESGNSGCILCSHKVQKEDFLTSEFCSSIRIASGWFPCLHTIHKMAFLPNYQLPSPL